MDKDKTQQFMMKVVGDVGASVAAGLVFIGDRVGLFQAMASAGPLRLDEVVAKTGLQARYVEEWLGGMVSAAYLTYDPEAQTYTLPDEHAFFLASQGTDHYWADCLKDCPGYCRWRQKSPPRSSRAVASRSRTMALTFP